MTIAKSIWKKNNKKLTYIVISIKYYFSKNRPFWSYEFHIKFKFETLKSLEEHELDVNTNEAIPSLLSHETTAKERQKQYNCLTQRIEREKKLFVITQKIQTRKDLDKTQKVKVKKQTVNSPAIYKFQSHRKC
ncbi:unnamed protein product [Nyctereutes procyonoides]|uniref:(raccoon dog) hypothetical protein n=1 Tax=Nyctereutes procyonoides TaxID=34880 RepID=A0A811ZPV1_NYCPR|nr:unnamed protein product [Nyctereutes procyonoides]